MTPVFEGLKVVELASVLAGPAVGMFFAELGAEVIKVENKLTGGDVTRTWKTTGGKEIQMLRPIIGVLIMERKSSSSI